MVADWDLACSTVSGNLCLIGASDTTNALMDELRPHLLEPVITVRSSGDSLELPAVGDAVGTLILFDVEGLALADQHYLMTWLAQCKRPPRVISTAQESILVMIGAGRFLAALYYRLNVICLDVAEVQPSNLLHERQHVVIDSNRDAADSVSH